VAHLVLAVAVLFGIVHSGSRYFYCEALGLSASDPCAAASGERRGASSPETVSERAADCCEIVALEAIPRAAQAPRTCVAPAPCVAVLALPIDETARSAPPSRGDRALARWRPPPRSSGDVRAQLMVFLI
jgi:hypothetical protein